MKSDQQRYAARVLARLKSNWPNATCSLAFENPFQLLVATILSAQCTDVRVNLVTGPLFRKYPTARDFVEASQEEIETAIQSTGFYHNKAKNIRQTSRILQEKYAGQVPAALDALLELPGVGRKTANVVLGNGFGIVAGIVVDTHVARLSRRLGLSEQKTPEKIERDLMERFPRKEWIDLSHFLIRLGREFCRARNPDCPHCPMNPICPRIGVRKGKE